MTNVYKGKQLNQSIVVTDLLNGRSVATMQPPYFLTEADFMRLKGSPPITAALATIVFSAVIGDAVSLGPKIYPLFEGGKSQLSSGEIYTMIGGIAISIVLYAIGFCWPNDKKKILKKIKSHFDNASTSSHVIERP